VAEILTRHLLLARLGIDQAARFMVTSAGTHAVTGVGMDPLSRAELALWGLDGAAARFAAHRLDMDVVRSADIVLTADRSHRSFVAAVEPSARRTTFCIREWERLLKGTDSVRLPADPVARARSISVGAHLRRGTLSYASSADDTIPNPGGQPATAHRVATRMIVSAIQRTVELLAMGASI
jgi:protein-tyrosine phosphatase